MYNTLDVNARIKQLFEINLEFGINGIIIFFELGNSFLSTKRRREETKLLLYLKRPPYLWNGKR